MTDLKQEAEHYKDIVIFDFIDTYKGNMTLKFMTAMNWTAHVSNSDVIIKADDDVLVNVNKVYETVTTLMKKETKLGDPNGYFIAGYCIRGVGPIRDPNDKWYISKDIYPSEHYPAYINGPCLGTTKDTIKALLKKLETTPVITIDDVSLGILVQVTPSATIECPDHWLVDGHSLDTQSVMEYRKYHAIHTAQVDVKVYEELWQKLQSLPVMENKQP